MTQRDRIYIEDLRVPCIIGIRPEERRSEQPLHVDVVLELDARRAGHSGRISETLDYDRISLELSTLLRFRRYRLLEMAAQELSAMLLGVHPRLERVRLRLTKPRALLGRARGAAVQVERDRSDFPRGHELTDFGEVDVLYESREAGLYLLHVAPGRGIAPHLHRRMRELEWLVSGTLERDGVELEGLAPRVWPLERVHRYDNRSTEAATLFCCDTPPFIREDEVLVTPRAEPRRNLPRPVPGGEVA